MNTYCSRPFTETKKLTHSQFNIYTQTQHFQKQFDSKKYQPKNKNVNMVDTEKVKEIAKNARIKITQKEAEKYTEDFNNILQKFQTIEQVDTEDVEPSFHPTKTESQTRKDREKQTLTREEVFQNTENHEEGKFKGPSA